jgi:hypothetical protein
VNETIEVVRLHDPALASVPFEKVAAYGRSREVCDLPELPADVEAVRFVFRRLTRAQVFDFVQRIDGDEARYVRAFMAGVVRIYGGRFGQHGFEPTAVRSATSRSSALALWTDEELDEARLAPADLEDIGQVVYLRSVSPFDCTPRYPLRLSSLAVWEGNARRYAEQTQAGAAPSNEQLSSG